MGQTLPHLQIHLDSRGRLSLAHIEAIAAKAGVNLSSRRHDYGVDGDFHEIAVRDGRYVESGFSLHFQLKASIRWSYDEQFLVYDLEAKTYNDLVSRNGQPGVTPLYLILLALPEDADQWLNWNELELKLAGGCYWDLLSGPQTSNQQSKRIRIPRTQTFNPDSLTALLQTLRTGG